MFASRPIARASLPRTLRSARAPRNLHARFESTSSSSSSSAGGSSHIATGLASGAAVAVVGYGLYSVSPAGRMAKKVNSAAKDATLYYNETTKKLQESTPDANAAVEYVKNMAYSYVAWIPGGRKYLDVAFKDLDTLRENHREDVEKIINESYAEFQEISKSGLSQESLQKALEALSHLSKKIGNLAGGAFQELLENHPDLKDKVGPNIDQLKQMGDSFGPEAKEEVNKTWDQVKEILAGGLSITSLNKARQIIQDKVEKVKQLGDEAWKKGLEQAKPYLDKNPKVKEMIENNADALKQGNAKELFEKIKSSVESGSTGDLEGYVSQAVDKVKSKGSSFGGLEQYFNMIPRGGEILPKLSQLKEVAEKHTHEGEAILKETMDEIQKVLKKQSDKAQSLVEKAGKDAK